MTCTWVCICLCWLTAKQVGKHTLSEGLLLKLKLAFILDCPKPATNLNQCSCLLSGAQEDAPDSPGVDAV